MKLQRSPAGPLRAECESELAAGLQPPHKTASLSQQDQISEIVHTEGGQNTFRNAFSLAEKDPKTHGSDCVGAETK